jgi:hypothetical protein
MNEVWTHEWTIVTWIFHLPINPRVKCVLNAWYECVRHMNYEWTNYAWFPFLSCEMLNLWCYVAKKGVNCLVIKTFGWHLTTNMY